MVQVLICTHEEMAVGVKKTAEFIMGPQKNLHAIAAYTDEHLDYQKMIAEFLAKHSSEPVVVLTDILGGSVNTTLGKMLDQYQNLHIISGVNLPMIAQLLLSNEKTLDETIQKTIAEAKNGIQYVNQTLTKQTSSLSDDF